MACQTLSLDIIGVCDYENTTGVEVEAVIVNKSDIDYNALTFDVSNPNLCTNFQLKSGKTGYSLKGVKKNNAVLLENVANAAGSDKTKHTFNGVFPMTALNTKAITQIKASSDGFVVIYMAKTVNIADVEAFRILGLEQGLYGSASHNSAENGGAYSLSLASADGSEEVKTIVFLKTTDYATTKALFDAKFIEP